MKQPAQQLQGMQSCIRLWLLTDTTPPMGATILLKHSAGSIMDGKVIRCKWAQL